MKKPLISVIIPCYNVEKYLNKCLDTVLNNTLKDIEVIAINDGSTDNTLDILNSYKDDRLKVYDQKNIGQAKTRNKAIKLAKADYLFFLDSDDYIDIDLLEKCYKEALNGNDIVITNAKRVEEDTNKIVPIETFKKYSDNNIINYILNSSGPAWKLVKKSIITDNNLYFYEDHIYEDIAVTPSWGLYATKIAYIKDTYYYYIIHQGSTMNQINYNKKLEDIFYSLDYLSNNFGTKNHDELEYIYIEHLLHAANLRFYNFKKYDMIDKISKIMKTKFPRWNKNIYYKQENIKYKIICKLFYKKNYLLLRLLLRK